MSAFKMYKVGMIMVRGGKTFVIVGGMCRAHALGVARRMYPNWHLTGEIEEMR
jgi:hypothetical protein